MRSVPGGWKPLLLVSAVAVAATVVVERAHLLPGGNSRRPEASNAYADPALCAQCHAGIAASYRKTGMGRAFYRPQPESVEGGPTLEKPFYHKASDGYFAMVVRDGSYYQRRWQVGFDGGSANVEEKRVDFVLGSGNHARTYLHLTPRNTLQQLPLGWYAEKGGSWAMNPGYDRADHPWATRLVGYECMFCHNGYPKIPEGHREGAEEEYALPLPEGIDCQRCHGPGQRHIRTAGRSGATKAAIRAAIVNPKRLSGEREIEVCMQCHLETTTLALPRWIQRAGRQPFSYVPGQALGDFRISFDRAGGSNQRFEVAQTVYRFRESKCVLASAGKLRCTTCHNPHDIPRGEAAAARYNGVCRDCHQPAGLSASPAHTAQADCVGCHMPKRRTDDVVHMVMTDHYIQRRAPEPDRLAEKVETHESPASAYRGEVVPYYPARLAVTGEDALDVALAQIRDASNLPAGMPRLAELLEKHRPPYAGYYVSLAEAYLKTGDGGKAMASFEKAAEREPGSLFALLKWTNALMESQQWQKAESPLRRAIALAPAEAQSWGLLGHVLWQQAKDAEAKAALEKGLALNPELPDLHNYLGALLMRSGDPAAAEKEFREALRINPAVAWWQSNLANLLASRGDLAQARHHFQASIRLKPDDSRARVGYARVLAGLNRTSEAEAQARAAVEADGGDPAAHELWGYMLAARGEMDGAARELFAAVRLQPDFWRAQFELGAVLGRKGDLFGAAQHLTIAAQGADPEVRASAQQLLRAMGR